MSNKLDYFWWENYLNKDRIIEINNYIENNFLNLEDKSQAATDVNGKILKTSTVKCLHTSLLKNVIPDVLSSVKICAQRVFGYELFEITDNECSNLNIYSSKNKEEYNWHIDNSGSELYDIKLTTLINISTQTYTGGNFFMFTQGEKEIKELNKPGNIIMFKSHISHKVTPVLTGERRTLAIFLHGPKFR